MVCPPRGYHSGPEHAARGRRGNRLALPRPERDSGQRRRSRRQTPGRRRLLGLPDGARSQTPGAQSHHRSRQERGGAGVSLLRRRAGRSRGPAGPAGGGGGCAIPPRLSLLPRDRRGAVSLADGGTADRQYPDQSGTLLDRRARGADPRAPRVPAAGRGAARYLRPADRPAGDELSASRPDVRSRRGAEVDRLAARRRGCWLCRRQGARPRRAKCRGARHSHLQRHRHRAGPLSR